MSVTSCLAEFKFADPKDKTLFDAVKKEYREDGLNNTEAAKKAADEVIEAIKKDYLALESIVNEKGGVLPPLPEHLIRIEKNKEKTENNNKQQDTVEKLETEKKGKQYGGNKPNYRNKKTGELLYSDGEMSHLKQTTFIDRFNEAHEVVDEKMDGYELIGNPDNGHKPNYENDEPLANTDDVGGEMFGNRRQAGISLDEVKEADDTKKRVLAQKQNIWKRPDYQELVDNGVQPVIAHSIKQVYDKISTKPRYAKHDNKFIYEYVEGVETLRDAVNDLLTDSSAMNKIMLEVAGKAEARMGGKPFDILGQLDKSDVENYLLDKVFPKNKSGNRWGRSNQKGNDRANAMGRVYNKLTFNVNGFVDALKAIEDGWPAKKEAWQRKYKVLSRDNLFSIKKYKDEFRVVQGHRVSADATFETEQEAKAYINKQSEWFLVKQKFSDVVRGFDTQEEAIKGGRHLEEMVKKVQFKEPDTPVEKSVREGQDFREGKNVSTQDLKDVIGFGQVNFGNWMKGDSPKKNRERQAHTNSIYDAAHDLAEVLGVPIKAISLNGMLNIAVGAQGKGGSAAHFIPGINDINITKRTGAGSLAHEFAHGLDHYFAVQAGLAKRDEPFLSDWTHIKNDAEIRPEIVEHFKTISEAMNKIEKSYTQEEIEESRTAGFKRDQKYLELWLKNIAVENSTKRYTSLIKKIKDGDVGKLEQLGKAKQQYVGKNINLLREEYKKIKGRYFPLDTAQAIHLYSQSIGQSLSAEEYFENHPKSRSVATRYLRSAEAKESKSGKSYWSTSWEMFARAFEVYVADKLAEKNGKNEYLTSDWKTNPDALPDFVAEAQTRHPQGIEREKVNLAFDGLINELKTKETDQGTAIYSRKGHVRSSPLKPKSTVAQLIKRLRFKLRKLSIPFKPVIVQSISNLPKALLDNHNVPNDVRGVAYKGKSYLVADNIKVDEAHRVLQHEVIGHTAMEALLGNDFNQLIELIGRLKKRGDKQVVQVLEEIKSSYIDNAGQYNLDKTQEAREVIAHIAEKNKTHIIVRKIIGLIKKALAKIGYTSIDNADL
ncbi:MAG: hypothetical protein GY829_01520, partial [Gammaproteobacteria bacterium]|nr:hypothetical protein [Gammaproteobacteria bacterium]